MPSFIFKLPDIGEGVVEAEITAWHIAIGDSVEEDAPIADAMTDKATIELTAPVDGVVTAIGCEEGDMLTVGSMLVTFETEAVVEDDGDMQDAEPSPSTPQDTPATGGKFVFKMPDIGEGVVEAEITAWHAAVGDTVSEDDPIADAMTDKATIELTSPVDGVITALGCGEGEMLAVGAMLASFDVVGEVAPAQTAPAKAPVNAPVNAPKKASGKAAEKPKAVAAPTPSSTAAVRAEKILASPAVRKRAREAGLQLAHARATGASGQVTHIDLDRLEEALEPAEGETRIKVIGLRRVIAQRMSESKRNIPHFTYVDEIDMTELEALRKRANAKSSEGRPKLTVLPFIIRAMALTLQDWPQFNARYDDAAGHISQFSGLNLGLATMTDKGLIVPVLKEAASLSIWDMAVEIARLAEGARTNKLTTDDLSGATTTLTSLGPLGGIVTTPVINRPEVAIFGPNKIRPHLVLKDGAVEERQVMNFSISCDHRVIDGYDAAAMMQDLKAYLQDPTFMFLA